MIVGTETNECPVSMISDKSAEIVQWFERLRMMRSSVGASPHAGDLLKWPAREVDAFVVLEQQRIKVENLMIISDRPPQRTPQ